MGCAYQPGFTTGGENGTEKAGSAYQLDWLTRLDSDSSEHSNRIGPQDILKIKKLITRSSAELRRHPDLIGPAAAVAADWLPAINSLKDAKRASPAVTPQMLLSMGRLLDRLETAADDRDLAAVAGRFGVIIRSGELDGETIDTAIFRLAQTVKSLTFADDASLRLTPRERGLADQDETLVVPAAAHAGGALGTRWRTDLVLTAAGGTPAVVNLALLPRDQANSQADTQQISIGSGQSLALDDVLDGLFGFTGTAALRVTSESGSVVVTSRTYNLEGDAGSSDSRTFGQFVPALSDDDAIVFGDQGRLVQLSHDPSLDRSHRTNMILVNGGEQPIDVEVELFTSGGQRLGVVSRSLAAWEFGQLDRVFEEVTSSVVDDGYAVVRVNTAGGRVFALASVVDNLTGDPVAVPAILGSPYEETFLTETLIIPAVAKVSGFAETDWRTDLVLHGLSGDATTASVGLLPRGQENWPPFGQQVQIPSGQSIRFNDVLGSLFGAIGAGTLRILPGSGAVAVSSRTYNVLGQGNAAGYPEGATFGQYMGPVESSRWFTFGDEALIPHLSHDPSLTTDSRTNLGLVNNSDHSIEIEVELYENDGTLLGSFTTTLRQWENVQISKVFELVTSDTVPGGYAVVRTTDATGSFVAYGSVVDNRTGDPITIDAIGIRRPTPAGLVASGDMLMKVFESGVLVRLVFETLRTGTLLDAIEAGLPDRVTRIPGGIVTELGRGTMMGDTMFVAGSIRLLDASVYEGSRVTGTLTIDIEDVAVDGLAPVVGDLELGLDLAQIGGDEVAGTVTLGSVGLSKSVSQFGGSLEFDTRICELYPIGGSITVMIAGEERTLTFSNSCDGSFDVDIPSAEYFSLFMETRNCQGAKTAGQQVMHLIQEDGQVSVDPSSPPNSTGRRRYDARGSVGSTTSYEASIRYAQKAGAGSAGERRVGGFQGQIGDSSNYVYYTGSYGYTVAEGDCRSSYYFGRDSPDFGAAVLTECEGSCAE